MPNEQVVTVPRITSSVVIVGEDLSPALVNSNEIFGGNPDTEAIVRIGSFLQSTYQSGKYSVVVTPDRIDLRVHTPDEIMPEELINAASVITNAIVQVTVGSVVSAIGFNYDKVVSLELPAGTATGGDYCRALFRDESIETILGEDLVTINPSATFSWAIEQMKIKVRLEPDQASEGQNLFVAINGHQQINEQFSLHDAISCVDQFIHTVKRIHERNRNR